MNVTYPQAPRMWTVVSESWLTIEKGLMTSDALQAVTLPCKYTTVQTVPYRMYRKLSPAPPSSLLRTIPPRHTQICGYSSIAAQLGTHTTLAMTSHTLTGPNLSLSCAPLPLGGLRPKAPELLSPGKGEAGKWGRALWTGPFFLQEHSQRVGRMRRRTGDLPTENAAT